VDGLDVRPTDLNPGPNSLNQIPHAPAEAPGDIQPVAPSATG